MGVTRGTYVTATAGGVGTTAVDARVDQAGLFTPNGDLAAVPGVLSGCAVTGIASGWAYNVAAGHVVTSRSATDGAVLMAVNGVTSTPAPVLADGVTAGSTSAPVSGSRWEIIWIRQRDLDNAEADNNAVLGVTQGTASGSPTKPSIPAGALALAESLVAAGAANTASGSVTITNVAAKVGLRGGIVAVANSTQRDLLSAFASATSPIIVDRLDTGAIERNASSGWVPLAQAQVFHAVASYGALWRTPTTQSGAPLQFAVTGKQVAMEAGAIENSGTLTLPATGQNAAAFAVPAGCAPAAKVIVPAFITNTSAGTNTLGALWFLTDGTVTFQTSAAISAAPAGTISVAVGGATWVTP